MRQTSAQIAVRRPRALAKRTSPIPRITPIRRQWRLEPVEPLTRRNDGDTRSATVDGSPVLTDLQRTALRWLSFFD